MNNFVKRTLSGILFVSLIVSSILLSSYTFALVFALICVLAVREFHTLTNSKIVNVNVIVAMIGAGLLFASSYINASGLMPAIGYALYGLFVVIVLISELYRKQDNPLNNWAYFIMGQVFIALPFSLLPLIVFVNHYQPLILLAVFVTIWVNDTGAYVVGVTMGKHRLFERISPKKSWEGFFGGAFFALLSGYAFSMFIPEISLVQWLIFSELVVVFGTYGDLVESLLKRTVHVKDSSNLIPGHGGILDRFDSMVLVAPVIYIYLNFLFK